MMVVVSEDRQKRTKRDMIVTELRSMIASGEILRGDRIQQDELAARFGTSITPVREALLLLEAEGVLVGEPHRGLRVAEADRERLKANYIMRCLAETYAAKRATLRMSRLDLDEAKRLVTAMEEAHRAGDGESVTSLNRAFHFLFYEKCGIAELTHEIEALWLSFPWDILQVMGYRVPDAIEEHKAILAAAEVGDIEGVAKAMGDHLKYSHLALMEHLTGSPAVDPFDVHVD